MIHGRLIFAFLKPRQFWRKHPQAIENQSDTPSGLHQWMIFWEKQNVQKTIGRDKHFLDPIEVMNHTYDVCEFKKSFS